MKKQLRLISLFFILLGLLSTKTLCAQLVSGLQGKGTKDDPVLIQSANDLKLFSDYVNAGENNARKYFKMEKDIDFTYEELVYDLDDDGVNESNFRPIGDQLTNSFSGFFDGGSHTICALKIKSTGEFVGLFGACVGDSLNSKAEIKNIVLSESQIECLTKGVFAGGISAYTQWCDLKKCSVSIEIASSADYAIVGGVNAYNYQNKIEDCSFRGTIKSTGLGATLGGVISAGGQGGNVNRCSANINISSTGDSCFIGGVAGSTHTPINNSYCVGTISNSGKAGTIGGFIGGITSGGNISNSYAVCSINSDENNETGGFAGVLMSSASINNSYYSDSWSGTNENNTLGTAKPETEMKTGSFVSTLNNNQTPSVWLADKENKNNGFPVLNPEISNLGIIAPKNGDKINIFYRNSNIEINGEHLKSVQIIDIQGRIIKKQAVAGNFCRIGFQQPTGIYIVTVETASYTHSSKLFIIQ